MNIIKRNKIFLFFSSFLYNLFHSPLLIACYFQKGVVFKGSFLKNVKIKATGNGKIYIGCKTIMENCILVANGFEGVIYIEGGGTNIKNSSFRATKNSGQIYIANGFTCESSEIKAHEGKKVTIGSDCMFSSGIIISTTDYHSVISKDDGVRVNDSKDIVIGNHVWLGRNVCVLKGVTIADDIVVGMGSMVSRSLELEHSVYAGSPARRIKSDVTWIRPLV